MSAQLLLDRAQTPAQIDALAADPMRYREALVDELPVELEARDAALARALEAIEPMIARAMGRRLEFALANDPIGAPTRNVFAQTVASYAANLELLRQRAYDVAARSRIADPDRIAESVVDAARGTLALRDALRDSILALVVELSGASIAEADRLARDRRLEEPVRARWSAIRRDLETLVGAPHAILVPRTKRLAELPFQLDDPDPSTEPTFADLIEMD